MDPTFVPSRNAAKPAANPCPPLARSDSPRRNRAPWRPNSEARRHKCNTAHLPVAAKGEVAVAESVIDGADGKSAGRINAQREDVMQKRNSSPTLRPLSGGIMAVIAVIAWFGTSMAAVAAAPRQMTFASPEAATDALVAASQAGKTTELEKILGPSGHKLIFSGDPIADREGRQTFAAAYAQKHEIDQASDSKATLIVSDDAWPFPIPLVKQGNAWRFDTKAGADEILNRRIGRNELNALEVTAAIVDAEQDYASKDRTGTGYLEYAQKFMSSPGKRDGLYWPATAGEPSPIGPLVVSARAEGYGPRGAHAKPAPYHGYFYRILTRQGKDAPGGARSYVVNGHMIGGFALVAFPAKYGDSGVMTFIVDQDGVIYEKNLGLNTATIAQKMTTFNPDASWTPHH